MPKLNKKNDFILELLSVIFMLTAVILATITFHGEITKKVFFFWINTTPIESCLAPSLITTLYAILIYSSLIVRNIIQFDFRKKIKTPIFFVLQLLTIILNIFFIASFITVFFGGEEIILFNLKIAPKIVLFLTIFFSWFGMKTIAGYSWIILFFLSVSRLQNADNIMGIWGAIYVIAGFLSILLQCVTNGQFKLLQQNFMTDFRNLSRKANNDIKNAEQKTKNTISGLYKSINSNSIKVEKPIIENIDDETLN